MSTLSSANVTDVSQKERTHMRLCLDMLIFTHNLGNWLISSATQHVIIPRTHQVKVETVVDLVFVESRITMCWQHLTVSVDVDATSLSRLQHYIELIHVMSGQ